MGALVRRLLLLLLLLVSMAAACGSSDQATEPGAAPEAHAGPSVPDAEPGAVPGAPAEPPFRCPVTIPEPGLVPPAPYRATPAARGHVWYGSEALWTALDARGEHEPRKSVWWSVRFPGGAVEEKPPISVRWQRLDALAPDIVEGPPGTNAHTRDGWLMIAGLDPDEPGCWRVTATYRGAFLSYTFVVR